MRVRRRARPISSFARGMDLNPVSGFPFLLVFMLLPWKNASRIENTRRQWKQNCCKVFAVFRWVPGANSENQAIVRRVLM